MMKVVDLSVETNRGPAEARIPKRDYKTTVIIPGIIAATAVVAWIVASAAILARIIAATAIVSRIVAATAALSWIVAATAVASRIIAPPTGVARVGTPACPAAHRRARLRFRAAAEACDQPNQSKGYRHGKTHKYWTDFGQFTVFHNKNSSVSMHLILVTALSMLPFFSQD